VEVGNASLRNILVRRNIAANLFKA
jgi:hypothetical protein